MTIRQESMEHSIHDISNEKDFPKIEAMIQLLYELNIGICFVKEWWISEENFRKHIYNRKDHQDRV